MKAPKEIDDIEETLNSIDEARHVLEAIINVLFRIERKLATEGQPLRTKPHIVSEIDDCVFYLNYLTKEKLHKLEQLENKT